MQCSFYLLLACITPLDIAFAFETTRAGESEFEDMKKFAANLLDNFKVGPSKSHISVSTFSDVIGTRTSFNEEFDKSKIVQYVRDLKTDSGDQSNIGDFLEVANNEIFTLQGGVRQSTARVLVLFTAGSFPKDQEFKAQEEARKLKAAGQDVQIVVVTVGASEQQSVLKNIASEPVESKLFSFTTTEELNDDVIERKIAESICSCKHY